MLIGFIFGYVCMFLFVCCLALQFSRLNRRIAVQTAKYQELIAVIVELQQINQLLIETNNELLARVSSPDVLDASIIEE